MKLKPILVFCASIALFTLISMHRFGDSGHAIAMISKDGGKARHGLHTEKKYGYLMAIVTATVLPPYRGDARVVLEGDKPVLHEIYLSKPVIDLGIRPFPEYQAPILKGLKPKSRIALWLVMHDIDRETATTYRLAFYDTRTGQSVLKLPITID